MLPNVLKNLVIDFICTCPKCGQRSSQIEFECKNCQLFSCDSCQLRDCEWCYWQRQEMISCPVCSARFITKTGQIVCLACVNCEKDCAENLDTTSQILYSVKSYENLFESQSLNIQH